MKKSLNTKNNRKTEMTRVNIEIEDELHKKAKLNALLKNQTLIRYLHEALELKIKEDEKKKK